MSKQYATLKDVAKLANTTAATVSYVLNDSKGRYISTEMRERVLHAAKTLDYIKSSAASSLRGKQRKMIAVLVPQYSNQFFTNLILAIENIASLYGYILSICNTFDDPDREKDVIQMMQQQRMDGYIIIPTRKGNENTEQLRKMEIPMVIVDRSLDNVEEYNRVSTSNYQCSYVGVNHLIEKGHKKIAFVGWESGVTDLICREEAYIDALVKNKISLKNKFIFNDSFESDTGYKMTKNIIETHKEITAIFYAYNIQALGGVKYLKENNVKIGEDISIAMIGTPDWAIVENFTCIDQKAYNLGRIAAEMIFNAINNETQSKYKCIIQDCALLKGNSVKNIN